MANLFERLIARMGYAKASGEEYPEWLRATASGEGETHIDPSKWESQADLYRRLSWVNIAVSMIAKAASTVPFSVLQLEGDERADIVNHPFELLLSRPNPLMSRYEFLEATVGYRALTGNAYWWLNRPNENTPPSEVWCIPSHKMKPVPDERMFLKGFLYDPGDGQEIALEPWEVVHFKSYNPLSVFVGLSPIEAIATVAVGDLQMQKWNTRLFGENNARLPGILAFSDPINDSAWEQLKKDAEDNAKKRQIMMMRNVGAGGVQWLQNAISQKDMEFLAGRNFTKEEIYSIYAPGLSSMLAVNATEANARAGLTTFSEFAVWPIMVAMAEKITNDILPAYSENLKGEFDDIRFRDRALELQEQNEYARTHTIDEVRMKWYDDAPMEDPRGLLLPLQVGASPIAVDAPSTGQTTDDALPASILAPENLEAEAGLNGAQITAAIALLSGVADNTVAPGVAIELLMTLGIGRERATRMVSETVAKIDPHVTAVVRTKGMDELSAWRNFATARLGKASRPFECDYIPEDVQAAVNDGLKACQTADEIKAVFDAVDLGEIDEPEALPIEPDFAPLVQGLADAVLALRGVGGDGNNDE